MLPHSYVCRIKVPFHRDTWINRGIYRYLCNEASNQQLFCCICPAVQWPNLGNLLHTIWVMQNKTFGKINRCLDFYSILTTEIYINKNRGSFNLIYVMRLKINSCFVAYPSRNSAFLPRPSSAAKFVPSHHWRFNGSFLSPTYNDCIMYGIECG